MGCSELARSILTKPAVYPSITADTDPLIYGAEATGLITKEDDEGRTGFNIINACEKRDAEIIAKLNRPWWKLW